MTLTTYSANYYLHKGFALIFVFAFLSTSISGLINPESLTVKHGEEIVETNLLNLIPFIVFGMLSCLFFIWMTQKYFRIKMNNEGITIIKLGKNLLYKWDEIEAINSVEWLWKGTIFSVKTNDGKKFYFHSDKPSVESRNLFKSGFRTKMTDFIQTKKNELGI